MADPEHVPEAFEEALQDERIHALAMEVDAKQAQDFSHGVPKPGGTVLMCGGCSQPSYQLHSIELHGLWFWHCGARDRYCLAEPRLRICLRSIIPMWRPHRSVRTTPSFRLRHRRTNWPEPVAFGVMGMMQPQGQLQVGLRVMQGASPQAA